MDQITPQYNPVPTTLRNKRNDTHVSLKNNPISVTSVDAKGYHELGHGIQKYGPIVILSTMIDRPSMNSRNPILDESTLASSFSSNGNTNNKSGKTSQNSAYAGVPQPGAWVTGYKQPLKFVPIG